MKKHVNLLLKEIEARNLKEKSELLKRQIDGIKHELKKIDKNRTKKEILEHINKILLVY